MRNIPNPKIMSEVKFPIEFLKALDEGKVKFSGNVVRSDEKGLFIISPSQGPPDYKYYIDICDLDALRVEASP